jgi:Berberine and berberine like
VRSASSGPRSSTSSDPPRWRRRRRAPRATTAYAGRDVAHNIVIEGIWLPGESGEHAAAETMWARRFLEALQPHRGGGVYVNFLDSDHDSSRVREAYGDDTYWRLAQVKAKYDPENVFHNNKNIEPARL